MMTIILATILLTITQVHEGYEEHTGLIIIIIILVLKVIIIIHVVIV